MSLTGNTVLQRLAELDLHLDAGGQTVIDLGTRKIECGRHALAVLAEFSRPRSLSDALAALQPAIQGAEEWRVLTATIVGLHEAGVLLDASGEPPPPRRPPAGYEAAAVHIKMLNDRARTETLLAGIREVVRAGDVVVDLGTGTGILAIAAARAGAKHVYAIEQSGIGEWAQALFAANGLADRITLVQGWSTEIQLPERGDVLVSEMIGNEPLGEQIVNVTADAVKRLLKPDARLIPSRLEVFGLPVAMPGEILERNTFEQSTLQAWRSRYGIDFGPLANAARSRPRAFLINPYKARGWRRLSEGVSLLELDLRALRGSVFRETAVATAVADGELNGVLVYFEAELGTGVRLSTHPAVVRADNHWLSPVWIPTGLLPVTTGERFAVNYCHNAAESPEGINVARLSSREHLAQIG